MYINQLQAKPLLQYLKEIEKHREFIILLAYRGIKIKLKRTLAGKIWVILNPLVNIAIYTIFFKLIVKVDWADGSYLSYLFSGFCIWNLFSAITIQGGAALIHNQEIINKNPFPRIVVHIALSLQIILEQFFFIIMVVIGVCLSYQPDIKMMLFILCSLILTFLFSFSNALLISILSLKNRDILQIIPVVFQVLVWFTPVFYPLSIISDKFQYLIYLNPICGLLEMMRVGLGMISEVNWIAIVPTILIIPYFIFSVYFFKNREKDVPDFL